MDYKKLGLKCGIEIHQQLEGKKLFCDCPTTIVDDDTFDTETTRKLRAVIGETGELDQAALQEMKKHKKYIYRAEKNTSCLVDLDEEPPHQMNKKALEAALQASLIVNAEVVDEVQIMRKTVIDGSNTSGFQRTSLVSQGGSIDTKEGKVGIQTICLEEDSAKIVNRNEHHDTYNLSRLGIPLVEIATDPDIKAPEQCKEAAEKIGMILRSTGKVKRGLGTIRQDVNVSIKEGRRVEVKGAQDLKMIPTLVDYEVRRQMALVEIEKRLSKVSIDDKKMSLTAIDVTDIFKKTKFKFMDNAIKRGDVVIAFKLSDFSGLLGYETQPSKRLGTEFSDYAKVKTGIGGIIHSDEKLEKYSLSDKEIDGLKKRLAVKNNDAFIMIVTDLNKSEEAVKEICRRAKMCKQGVISEVRKANPDGTTSFMRPMPGAARMYPETDTTPIKTNIKDIIIPELIEDKRGRLIDSLNLGKDLAQVVAKSGKADIFESFVGSFKKIKPAFIAETMFSTPKTLKRKHGVDETILTDNNFKDLFNRLNKNEITKDAVEDILLSICKRQEIDYKKYAPLSDKDLEKEIKHIMKESGSIEFKILIGKVMGTLKGRAEGRKIMEMLKKLSQ